MNSLLWKSSSPVQCTTAQYAKAVVSSNEYADSKQPLPYFGSPAEKYKAEEGRLGYVERGWPWYQLYVINASIAIFLIYFIFLREENDIDEKLDREIQDLVVNMELDTLKTTFNYNRENGLSNDVVVARLIDLGYPKTVKKK